MEIDQAQYLKILRPRTSFMIFKKDYSIEYPHKVKGKKIDYLNELYKNEYKNAKRNNKDFIDKYKEK